MKRRLFALGCVLCAAGYLASVAAACHSEIAGSMDCAGVVSYTATAWNGSDATVASRTNTDVRVFASTDGGKTWTQIGSGAFTQSDGFTFSGTYQAGSATSVDLEVEEYANWGSGDAPAEPRYATATRPSNCATPPTPPSPPAPPVPPAPATPPAAPVAPPSVSLVKLERIGSTGDFVAGPLTGVVGNTVAYEIVVGNTGSTTISVNLTDDGCDAGTLAPTGPQAILPGATRTFTCSHVLAAADGAEYDNTALATASNAGSAQATATASVTTKIGAAAVSAVTETGSSTGSKSTKGGTTTKTKTVHKTAKKVKKVEKRAKPARPVIHTADFTG